MKYNKNLAGVQITDEIINRSSSASARLSHDTMLASTVVVRTAAGGGGTLLTLTTDYTLGSEDTRLTTEAGVTVYTTLAVVNGAYHSTPLYVSYKTVGDYAEAEDVVPAGSMSMFAGASAPTGWLMCDGSAVSRASYYGLFAAIGTTWGSGDGSTTFNLPDMRGAAPAGAGTSTGYTQNETLALGTKYNDQIQDHGHKIDQNTTAYTDIDNKGAVGTAAGTLALGDVSSVLFETKIANVQSYGAISPRVGNVTRGKRVGVNFIIKT